LIVFASKEDMHMITNVVAKVDRLLAQVLIEAIIMDVKLTDSLEFGVSAMMPPRKNGNLTSIAGMNNGQSLFSGVSNLTSGLPGGFTYFGKYGGDLNVAVTAIAGNGRGQVLQTPRVQTSHAMPATFFTGETVPYITSSSYGGYGYGASSQYQQLEVGISLDVTPYITPDGLVVMDIQQTIEEVSGYTEIANVGKVPNTTRREASSMVSVRDSDTIMLGGYIRNAKNKGKSGIPILMDIPGLGPLFRKSTSDNSRSELIILLRPTVLATPQDAAIIAGQEQQRMPGIREMEEEMKQMESDRNAHADKKLGKGKKKAP
jgi:general secretion pathway protein D